MSTGQNAKLFLDVIGDAPQPVTGYRLEQLGGKWVTISNNGVVRTASGRYLFVVAPDGTVFVSRRTPPQVVRTVSHADLAAGFDVLYAGEVQFSGRTNRGALRWWNNYSGHYLPDGSFAHQAGLPMKLFVAAYP
jgi:hypothetical protein